MVDYIDFRLGQVVVIPGTEVGMLNPEEPFSPVLKRCLELMRELRHAESYRSERGDLFWEPKEAFFEIMGTSETESYPSRTGAHGTVFVQDRIFNLAEEVPFNSSFNARLTRTLAFLAERDAVVRDRRGESDWWMTRRSSTDGSLEDELGLTLGEIARALSDVKNGRHQTISRVLTFGWSGLDLDATMRFVRGPSIFQQRGSSFYARWMTAVGLIEPSTVCGEQSAPHYH